MARTAGPWPERPCERSEQERETTLAECRSVQQHRTLTLMHIGSLGAAGPVGTALAARLASAGHETTTGSRSKHRAVGARDSAIDEWQPKELHIDSVGNLGAAEGEVVVSATPRNAAAETALQCVFQRSTAVQGRVSWPRNAAAETACSVLRRTSRQGGRLHGQRTVIATFGYRRWPARLATTHSLSR